MIHITNHTKTTLTLQIITDTTIYEYYTLGCTFIKQNDKFIDKEDSLALHILIRNLSVFKSLINQNVNYILARFIFPDMFYHYTDDKLGLLSIKGILIRTLYSAVLDHPVAISLCNSLHIDDYYLEICNQDITRYIKNILPTIRDPFEKAIVAFHHDPRKSLATFETLVSTPLIEFYKAMATCSKVQRCEKLKDIALEFPHAYFILLQYENWRENYQKALDKQVPYALYCFASKDIVKGDCTPHRRKELYEMLCISAKTGSLKSLKFLIENQGWLAEFAPDWLAEAKNQFEYRYIGSGSQTDIMEILKLNPIFTFAAHDSE